jgi:HlyD family secretion protein
MFRWIRLWPLPLLVLVVFSCAKNKEQTTVQRRSITESIYASVIVQPDSLYEVYAIVSGIIDNIPVEEGDLIVKDQAIIQITNNTPKLNTQNAKLAYDLAYQNYRGSSAILKGIADEIDAAELRYRNDSINFFRQASLWKQNIGSKAQYDSKKLAYQLSLNSLNLLRDKLKRTENELKTALEQAQNNYKSSLIATKDFTIKSSMSGKLYALYKEPGELVTTMEPLASIGSATHFVIELLVDEVDIVNVSLGQNVLVTLEAYQDQVFEAKISKIFPKKDERNQTFLVEALFNLPPPKLYPGLSGEANIIIDQHKDVLTIPKAYIVDDTKVLTDDGLKTIEIGLESMEYVEIRSGLAENTVIYKAQ